MLVGDVYQVNRWNHADSTFLALAPSLMYNSKPWKIHGADQNVQVSRSRHGKQSYYWTVDRFHTNRVLQMVQGYPD
jgi:hypothetical protein